jgi:hypothetical protein
VVKYAEALRADKDRAHRPYGLVIDGPSLVYVIMPEAQEVERSTEVLENGYALI